MIKANSQIAKEAHVTFTSIEQEIKNDRETWLERFNMHLEKLLQRTNKGNQMMRHMAYH